MPRDHMRRRVQARRLFPPKATAPLMSTVICGVEIAAPAAAAALVVGLVANGRSVR
jgi:hypothetical protein